MCVIIPVEAIPLVFLLRTRPNRVSFVFNVNDLFCSRMYVLSIKDKHVVNDKKAIANMFTNLQM